MGGEKQSRSTTFYGWTGGHECPDAARRTDAGLAAIFEEYGAQGDEFSLVLGDFNADLGDLPVALDAVSPGWTDLGACPTWMPDGPRNTCFVHNDSPGTRRDYVLCSPKLLPFIAGFRVYFHHAIPTHVVLGVAISPSGENSVVSRFRIPSSLVPAVWDNKDHEAAHRELACHFIEEELNTRQHDLDLMVEGHTNSDDHWHTLSISFERGLMRAVGIAPEAPEARPFKGRGESTKDSKGAFPTYLAIFTR